MIQMGKMIRKRRSQLGMTLVELGKGIMSKSVLSRIENELQDPDIFDLHAVLERLGLSLDYFEVIVSEEEYERLQNRATEIKFNTVVIPEKVYLKDMRKSKGFSQEHLAEGICARETISNIENGRTPNRNILKTVSERMGEPWCRYFSYVETMELDLYPLVKQYQRLAAENKGEEANALFLELQSRLDVSLPVNRQFIESSELILKRKAEEVPAAEALAALETCLRYTMPEYDGSVSRIPHLQEEIILEEIISCMRQLKWEDKATQLLQQLIKKRGKKLKVSANVTDFLNIV